MRSDCTAARTLLPAVFVFSVAMLSGAPVHALDAPDIDWIGDVHRKIPKTVVNPEADAASRRARSTELQFAAVRNTPNDAQPDRPGAVETALISALAAEDIESVKRLLAAPVKLNAADERGRVPLSIAVERGQSEMVRLLLEAGANPDLRGADGFTPLGLASLRGYCRVARLLIRAGADPDRRSANGRTPLHDAVAFGHGACVDELMAGAADLSLPNRDGLAPLDIAISSGRLQFAARLLEAGAQSNTLDAVGLAAIKGALPPARSARNRGPMR